MPIGLSEITTGTGTATLTSDERCWIRDVLGVSNYDSDSKYQTTETRFDRFGSFDNKSMRDLMKKYDALGESTFKSLEDGADIDLSRDRARIALQMFNKVFADGSSTPVDNIDTSKYAESGSAVSMVPVTYADEIETETEY